MLRIFDVNSLEKSNDNKTIFINPSKQVEVKPISFICNLDIVQGDA